MNKMICILPIPADYRPDQPGRILANLDRELCRVAGGFSRYLGTGGWQDGPGAPVLTEKHFRYEVCLFNCTPGMVEDCLAAFRAAGRKLSQEVLHIEGWAGGNDLTVDLTKRRETPAPLTGHDVFKSTR